jgi:hypothetical protein
VRVKGEHLNYALIKYKPHMMTIWKGEQIYTVKEEPWRSGKQLSERHYDVEDTNHSISGPMHDYILKYKLNEPEEGNLKGATTTTTTP